MTTRSELSERLPHPVDTVKGLIEEHQVNRAGKRLAREYLKTLGQYGVTIETIPLTKKSVSQETTMYVLSEGELLAVNYLTWTDSITTQLDLSISRTDRVLAQISESHQIFSHRAISTPGSDRKTRLTQLSKFEPAIRETYQSLEATRAILGGDRFIDNQGNYVKLGRAIDFKAPRLKLF